jgi:signal peptidase I
LAAILGMAAIGTWAISTHRISYVVTHGVSMEPVYHADDLVFIAKADSYKVGQIAAYHSPSADIEVLHRIIDGDNTGYVFQGDNNDFVDPVRLSADELIGHALFHVPYGGKWLKPLLSPTSLGMLGFLLVSGGAATIKSRRDIPRGRRKKRANGMSGGGGSWATAAAVFKAVSRLHPALRGLAVATAVCGVVGLVLGVLGWMKPTTESVSRAGKAGESMTFAYSAEVPRSAAYDGTTVYSPDPIFRKLADVVDLHMNYRGEPGRVEVSARLSSQNGWHKTLNLSQPRQFTSDRYTGKIQLNLPSFDQLIAEAGKAIGADMGPTTLAITARVRHGDGTAFEPQVSFNLAPLQLTLAGGSESLVVDQSSVAAGSSVQDRRIGGFGYHPLTAAEARKYAVYLLLMALIGAGIVAWMALGHVPLRTRTQIQRRYPHLIVPVEPMASPPGKPVVIVDTFPALVKLAEKYGQMILTWTRPDGADDFVVRDEGILYRYRIDPNVTSPQAAPPGPTPDPAPAGRSGRAESAPATTPVMEPSTTETTPVMGLPSAPGLPSDSGTEGVEDPTTGDTAEPTEPQSPVKKAPPRKRAARPAATKTAAAKAAAKTTGTRAPAKRARAAAKPPRTPEPETEAHGEPTVAATEADLEPTAETHLETTAPAVAADREPSASASSPHSESSAADTENQLDQPATETERSTSAETLLTVGSPNKTPAGTDQQPPGALTPETTTADSKAPDEEIADHKVTAKPSPDPIETAASDETVVPDETEPPAVTAEALRPEHDDVQAEPDPQSPEAVEPNTPAITAEPGASSPSTGGQERTARNQKRSNRRKSRSRRTPQPTVDEPQPAPEPISPADEARHAMKDLAERNTPMTPPEPGATREPQAEPVAWPEEPSAPAVRNEEPFYDFLPAAKRQPATVDDLDEPDA